MQATMANRAATTPPHCAVSPPTTCGSSSALAAPQPLPPRAIAALPRGAATHPTPRGRRIQAMAGFHDAQSSDPGYAAPTPSPGDAQLPLLLPLLCLHSGRGNSCWQPPTTTRDSGGCPSKSPRNRPSTRLPPGSRMCAATRRLANCLLPAPCSGPMSSCMFSSTA
ncbi:uncharacterized protein LOC123448442 [Hordeum vulgare subsp. vulgare]|uniref:uncharacterized protein LOC123448442 n=1 Tax=Hordeum vulgare subsp. vulgare TaxID=112509 RepID=UPI001D1A3A85|nr:uncharacterized protein LOC123448442 [Hordeum vulgare subsp. vulgare]